MPRKRSLVKKSEEFAVKPEEKANLENDSKKPKVRDPTTFEKSVYNVCGQIPSGRFSTYQAIAKFLGSHPRAAQLIPPTPATTRGASVHLDVDAQQGRLLYAHGKCIYLRSIERPAESTVYKEHTCATTVARIAPSGYYVASGDVQGNIRIWDVTQESNILKYTSKILAGKLRDIAWDGESQRVLACGEGKEKYGHVFLADSGSSVGEILGHSKTINACTLRPDRPFRAVTGSDDTTLTFYHGTPYKFVSTVKTHARFVQDVRYSMDGAHFVSVGSDGKVILYEGATANVVKEFSSDGHQGGVFSVAWSPDSRRCLTSGADGFAKLWDIESASVVQSFDMNRCKERSPDDQQVGNAWYQNTLISLSLNGTLNYLDERTGEKPRQRITGHMKGITAMSPPEVAENDTFKSSSFYTGSYDGQIYEWKVDALNEGGQSVQGNGHENSVTDLLTNADTLYTCGMDDSFRSVSVSTVAFKSLIQKYDTAPKGLASFQAPSASTSVILLALGNKIDAFQSVSEVSEASYKLVGTLQVPFSITSLACTEHGHYLAIGSEDTQVYLYECANPAAESLLWTACKVLDGHRGSITALAFSPNQKYLAVGDAARHIMLYDVPNWDVRVRQWIFHQARIHHVAWSPDSQLLASGSLDSHVIVWNVAQPGKRITMSNAHPEGVSRVRFLSADKFISVGQDACIRIWHLSS